MDRDDDYPEIDPEMLNLLERCQAALDAGLSIDAEESIKDLFAAVSDWTDANPSPDWDLTVEAANCEARGDWNGAEAAYQKMLAIAREPHELHVAHRNLAALSLLLNREAAVIEHRRMATEAARKRDLTILLLMALEQESWSFVAFGRWNDARNCIEQAFQILVQDVDQEYTQFLGVNLILRAQCRIADKQLSAAQADLDSAREQFEPMAQVEIAAGVQSSLASWWAAIGQLRTAQQDLAGAIDAWQEAVRLEKHVNSLPHCADVYTALSVAGSLKGLAEAQANAGRLDAARDSLTERSALLELLGVPASEDQ
jgi:tetratricopeptide (TPR) repeat protein